MNQLMRRWIWLVGLVVGMSLFSTSHARLTIATGQKDAMYFRIGTAINSLVGDDWEVRISDGTRDNISLLDEGTANFGIVQSDILYRMRESDDKAEADKVKKLRGVAALFPEYVQILVREDSDIKKVMDLAGRRIYLGKHGSGTRKNAEDILESFFISEMSYQDVGSDLSVAEAKQALADGGIEAVFATSGTLHAAVPVGGVRIRAISLSAEERVKIKLTHEYYGFSKVAGGGGEEQLMAFTRAVLVVRADNPKTVVPEGVLRTLAERLPSELEPEYRRLEHENSDWEKRDLDLFSGVLSTRGIPVELSDIVRDVYLENNYLMNVRGLQVAAAGFGFMLLLVVLSHRGVSWSWFIEARFLGRETYGAKWDRLEDAMLKVVRPPVMVTIWILTTCLLVDVLLILHFEDGYAITEDVRNPFASQGMVELLTWLITFATTGYPQDLFPNSLGGKIAAGAIPLIGFGNLIFLVLYSNVKRNERADKEARGAEVPQLKGHVVISGWNDRVPRLIEEITAHSLTHKPLQVVVLAEHPKEKPLDAYGFRPRAAYYSRGSGSSYEQLEKVNVRDAKALVIVADDYKVQHNNWRGVYTAVAARKYRERFGFPVIAELFFEGNEPRFRSAGVTKLVPIEKITSRLMAHACMNPGVSDLITTLLSFNSGKTVHMVGKKDSGRIWSLVEGMSLGSAIPKLREVGLQLVSVYREVDEGFVHAESEMEFREDSPYVIGPFDPNRDHTIGSGDQLLVVSQGHASSQLETLGQNLATFHESCRFARGEEVVLVVGPDVSSSRKLVSAVAAYAKSILFVAVGAEGGASPKFVENVDVVTAGLLDNESLNALMDEREDLFTSVTRAVVFGPNRQASSRGGRELAFDEREIVTDDDETIAHAMLLIGCYQEKFKRRLHVVAEMRSDANLKLFHDVGIAQPIPTDRLIKLVTAQMVFHGGRVSEFFLKAMDIEKSNGKARLERLAVLTLSEALRSDILGLRFDDVAKALFAAGYQMLAIMKSSGEIVLNPPAGSDDARYQLEAKDSLFVFRAP